jgi:hypothetical protein
VDREVRKGLNESWFREVNERLEQRADAQGAAEAFQVLCECEREDCAERITITIADYERVRTDPRAFVVLPTHVDAEVEQQVVSTHGDYVVVQKLGNAGLVAEIENPREG